MEKLVLIDRSEGVATVSLNRPEQLNALSIALRVALVEAFSALKDDQSIRVIILTGKGRAFSAGLDLKELGQKECAETVIRKVTRIYKQQFVKSASLSLAP